MSISRRHFLQRGVAFSLGFGGLSALMGRHGHSVAAALAVHPPSGAFAGYGDVVPDPARMLDLPKGFTYRVISRQGEKMADGLVVPGRPDAMAAFPGPNGTTVIVCNHETESTWLDHSPFGRDNSLLGTFDKAKLFDAGQGKYPSLGGTTNIVYDPKSGVVHRQFLTLAGTNRNCAGGPTPWGTWLSCEEDATAKGDGEAEQDHGWIFEVRPKAQPFLEDPRPIKAMGRFMHEAIAIDPRTGIVYLSEDRKDGLLYRFIPSQRAEDFGDLHRGGRLQTLVIKDRKSCDTSNHDGSPAIERGVRLACEWIDLDETHAPKDDLRKRGFAAGAAMFARGEGMWWGEPLEHDGNALPGRVYFAATTGGRAKKGQLWRYIPSAHEGTTAEADSPGMLELFVEPNDGKVIENADNITVAPWGDLFVAEDAATEEVDPSNRLLRVRPDGSVSTFARNVRSDSELAGVCFSPDGETMFVNIQLDGLTLAIQGPWRG
jgi:secreted PhoX family phosphatase